MKEILITSSVLILALLVLRLLFGKRVRRTLIYGAWALVALRLLIPVQIGQLNFSVLSAAQPLTETVTEISGLRVIGQNEREAETQVILEYIQQDQTVFTPEVQAFIQQSLESNSTEEEIATHLSKTQSNKDTFIPEMQAQVARQVEEQTDFVSLGQLLTGLWLVGAAAMATWFVVTNLHFSRKLRKTAETWECDSPIPVFVSDQVASPCLVGIFRPVVYLTPQCLSGEEKMGLVLTHELTHYRHRDHLWAVVRCLCLCIYWFHPLVWMAAWVSRRDCELACDEGALKQLGDENRIAYGKTLLEVVSDASTHASLMRTATAMYETKEQLKERVNFIVKRRKISLIAAICMVLVCAIVAGCAITGPGTAENAATARAYISAGIDDGKLGIVCNDVRIFTDHEDGGRILLTKSLDGASAVRLTAGSELLLIQNATVERIAGSVASYRFSTAGNAIAFSVEEENAAEGRQPGLYLYQKETGKIETIAAASEGRIYSYAISPDGKTVAYLVSNDAGGLLYIYRDGTHTLRAQGDSDLPFNAMISINNTADILYLRGTRTLLSVDAEGNQTKVGRFSQQYIREYDNNNSYNLFYLNADHSQILYFGTNTFLSDHGREGTQLFQGIKRPVQPAFSNFHRTYPHGTRADYTVTCNFADLSELAMYFGVREGYLSYPDANGSFVDAELSGAAIYPNCCLDPTGRYLFYRTSDMRLHLADLQTGQTYAELAYATWKYTVSYDFSTFYYVEQIQEEEEYASYLYQCDARDGSQQRKIQTPQVLDLFCSENNQLFFYASEGQQKNFYTLTQDGEVKLLLEDVSYVFQDESGAICVDMGEEVYIVRAGVLYPVQEGGK